MYSNSKEKQIGSRVKERVTDIAPQKFGDCTAERFHTCVNFVVI